MLLDSDYDFQGHLDEFQTLVDCYSHGSKGLKPYEILLLYRQCLPDGSTRAQMFDTYLIYLALFTFSIIFSFLTYIVVEGPTSTLLRIFFGVAKSESAPVPEIKASLVPTDEQD